MKPGLRLLLLLPLLFAACNHDIIEDTDAPIDSSSAASIGPDDYINYDDFNRTITITWSDSGVTVDGDEDGFVSVNGTRVTADSTSDTTKVVKYILTGTCSDGSFKLYSLRKQALVLHGLHLTNYGGAPINNQSHKRTFVVIEGINALFDGELDVPVEYGETTEGEDLKAAFFSEGQLIFSGSKGSLGVYAQGKAAITSDDYIRFIDPGLVMARSIAGHGIRGKDAVQIDGGEIAGASFADGKKALCSDGTVTINGGEVHLAAYGGVLTETTDSGTELTSAAAIKSDGIFTMAGGTLEAGSTGQGGKGISGDGAAFFTGGTVKVAASGSTDGSSNSGGWPGGGRPPGSRAGWDSGQNTATDTSKGAKGIKFDGDITVSGGSIEVKSTNNEALESKGKLTVTGGSVYAYSDTDDAINSAGDMHLSGGYVCGWSAGNDGIDANGNLYIDGAAVYAVCTKGNPEVALDANTEGGKKLYLQSGSLVAVGGIESGSSITGSAYSTSSWTKSGWYTLLDSNSKVLFSFKTPSSSSNTTMIVYNDGGNVTLQKSDSTQGWEFMWDYRGSTSGSAENGSEVSLSAYSGGGGMHR